MVKFIIGKKGSGKTNKLIDMVNEAVKTDKGHIVFINNSARHMFSLNYKVRLIDTQNFKIDSYETLYGLICGILSQDYDVSNIFVDSITKIVGDIDLKHGEDVISELDKLLEESNVNLVVTASVDVDAAPEFIKKYL